MKRDREEKGERNTRSHQPLKGSEKGEKWLTHAKEIFVVNAIGGRGICLYISNFDSVRRLAMLGERGKGGRWSFCIRMVKSR